VQYWNGYLFNLELETQPFSLLIVNIIAFVNNSWSGRYADYQTLRTVVDSNNGSEKKYFICANMYQ